MSHAQGYGMITVPLIARGNHVSQIESQEDACASQRNAKPVDGVKQLQVTAAEPSGIPRTFARGRADQVRQRLADLGVLESDVDAAVKWARDP